jgi:hypothetical protein
VGILIRSGTFCVCNERGRIYIHVMFLLDSVVTGDVIVDLHITMVHYQSISPQSEDLSCL